MISKKGIPVNSTIINAAAPITGGRNCPLDDAATSTPPATCGGNPTFFIKGIVNVPVVTAFAVELPEILPIIPLATTLALAGPPLYLPNPRMARSMNIFPAPVDSSIAPNSIKINTNWAEAYIGELKIPLLLYVISYTNLEKSPLLW